ncbi:MAG: DUF2461 domain-containing protein [Chitinophagales bacterium]
MQRTQVSTTTLQFLTDLSENNNREWFAENKKRFEAAKANMKVFGERLLEEMQQHDKIEKIKLYRIYRDVRFSKDKTPYKNSLSGSFTRASKWLRGGYYFHVEPNNSFIGGGFWGPNSADLKRLRQEFVADPESLRAIIHSKDFQKAFGTLEGNQLKTAPRGYAKDHPSVDLLRYKQFLVSQTFTDKEVLSPDFALQLSEGFKAMRPFFDYMSEVLTTDENGVPIF